MQASLKAFVYSLPALNIKENSNKSDYTKYNYQQMQ